MTKSISQHDVSMIFVIDNDASVRDSVNQVIRVAGLQSQGFSSSQELLKTVLPDVPSCLLVDVSVPGAKGLQVQDELVKAGIQIPVIFVSECCDIPTTVKAMRNGAIDFLTKPLQYQELLDAVHLALSLDRLRRDREKSLAIIKASFLSLTCRERELFKYVTDGLKNKQIASQMGIAEITVKVHRGNLTRKMAAKSLPDLVNMAHALGINSQYTRA